jgi:hypothetical protein
MLPSKPVSLRASTHIRFHETGKGFLIFSLGGGASQFLSAVGQTPGLKHFQCIATAGSGMSQNARPSKQSGVTKIRPLPLSRKMSISIASWCITLETLPKHLRLIAQSGQPVYRAVPFGSRSERSTLLKIQMRPLGGFQHDQAKSNGSVSDQADAGVLFSHRFFIRCFFVFWIRKPHQMRRTANKV